MVYFMENPIKMDDLGGFPIFLVQHPYIIYDPSNVERNPSEPSMSRLPEVDLSVDHKEN